MKMIAGRRVDMTATCVCLGSGSGKVGSCSLASRCIMTVMPVGRGKLKPTSFSSAPIKHMPSRTEKEEEEEELEVAVRRSHNDLPLLFLGSLR